MIIGLRCIQEGFWGGKTRIFAPYLDDTNNEVSRHLVSKSHGFWLEPNYIEIEFIWLSTISDTRFSTNILRTFRGVIIHPGIITDSDQKKISFNSIERDRKTLLDNNGRVRAPHNSKLWSVIFLKGVNLLLAHRRLSVTFPKESMLCT